MINYPRVTMLIRVAGELKQRSLLLVPTGSGLFYCMLATICVNVSRSSVNVFVSCERLTINMLFDQAATQSFQFLRRNRIDFNRLALKFLARESFSFVGLVGSFISMICWSVTATTSNVMSAPLISRRLFSTAPWNVSPGWIADRRSNRGMPACVLL